MIGSVPQETFAQEGMQYNMDGLTGNTLDSHRLIAHAGDQGPEKQDALVEGLFKAYFTEVGCSYSCIAATMPGTGRLALRKIYMESPLVASCSCGAELCDCKEGKLPLKEGAAVEERRLI